MKFTVPLLFALTLMMSSLAMADAQRHDDGARRDEVRDDIHAHARVHEDARASAPPINAALLGQYDSVIDFCVAANPRAAGDYRSSMRDLTRSLRERDLEAARKSSAYRQTYKGMEGLLESIPRAARKSACENLLTRS